MNRQYMCVSSYSFLCKKENLNLKFKDDKSKRKLKLYCNVNL